MERSVRRMKLPQVDLELVKGVLVEYVDVAAAVHEDFRLSNVLDHRANDQGEPTSLDHVVRVVTPVKGDRPL